MSPSEKHMGRPIKRFAIHYDERGEYEHPNGDFVHYEDHLAALAKVEAETREACAEVLRTYGPVTQDFADTQICAALDDAANAILAEGEMPQDGGSHGDQ